MATRFFPPTSSFHRDDYREFGFRYTIRLTDIAYPAASKKNIAQNCATGKQNIIQVGVASPKIRNSTHNLNKPAPT